MSKQSKEERTLERILKAAKTDSLEDIRVTLYEDGAVVWVSQRCYADRISQEFLGGRKTFCRRYSPVKVLVKDKFEFTSSIPDPF